MLFNNFNLNLKFGFLISLFSTLGSLFFSIVQKFIPCDLCWYQRVFMISILAVHIVGLVSNDKNYVKYATPLTAIGTLIAFYHNLLQYKIIPEDFGTCVLGIPCTVEYLNLFGFITIPLLSLGAYLSLMFLLIMNKRLVNRS